MTIERTDPPHEADERATLTGYLEYHRRTLAIKCDGLTDAQLRERSVPPAKMSLLGLVRHLADVERGWFQTTIAGEDIKPYFYGEENPDGDFDDVDEADVSKAFATWEAACERSRKITADHDLGFMGTHPRGGTYSVRWILCHVLEEYARHNGHADFLRERIDGAVGE